MTPPKPVIRRDAAPPDSWVGHGPRQAISVIEITIDKKGKVRNPRVIQSGGKAADAEALSAIRGWLFKPAKCDDSPVETKLNVEMTISLR